MMWLNPDCRYTYCSVYMARRSAGVIRCWDSVIIPIGLSLFIYIYPLHVQKSLWISSWLYSFNHIIQYKTCADKTSPKGLTRGDKRSAAKFIYHLGKKYSFEMRLSPWGVCVCVVDIDWREIEGELGITC